MDTVIRRASHRDAMKVTAIYFLLGAIWVALTDGLAATFVATYAASTAIQIGSDWLFLIITAAIIFQLVSRLLAQRAETIQLVEAARDELRGTSQRMIDLLGASPTILHAQQPGDGQPLTTWVSENLQRITGYTSKEALLPGWWQAHVHPEDREVALAAYQKLLTAGEVRLEYRFIRADNEIIWVFDEQRIVRRSEAEFTEIIGAWTEITERKVAELALLETQAILQAAQERLKRAIVASKVGLWDWNVRTNEVHYMPEAKQQLGHEDDEMGSNMEEWTERIHPDDVDRVKKYKAEYIGNPDHFYAQEFRLRHKDGSYRWILAQGSIESDDLGHPVRILGTHVDITEQKRLEAEFFQAQKMESVGRLAGGVAHDFNNLLTVISGYTEMAMTELPEGTALYRDLIQVRRAASRAADLTRQLLAFSRRQVLRPKVLNLNQIVLDAEKMLRRLIGEDIRFVMKPVDTLGTVVADPGQMEQVIMNLVINARDAMPTGGCVTIETSNLKFDESAATRHFFIAPGPYVCVAVSDTGIGMDKLTQEKIFEPFFTTKDPDKGTGLGLATVYGIVKQSGGSIVVYSEVGHGTTFKVYLPRVDEETPATSIVDIPNATQCGNETVLLVEDEDALRHLAERILAQAGYKVLAAASGADAIAMCDSEITKPDILLTDVIMPGMSGPELAKQLGERCSGMKVLFMSGYTDTAIAAHGVLEEGTKLVNKPFTAAQLTIKIRQMLDAKPSAAKLN